MLGEFPAEGNGGGRGQERTGKFRLRIPQALALPCNSDDRKSGQNPVTSLHNRFAGGSPAGRSLMIITVATMKGGSGKSTVASCLAVHWHLDGRRPTIIDADRSGR